MPGALTPVVTYWVGRRAFGLAEGILAGFALAIYGPLVFTDGQLEKEGLGALVAALALACSACMAEPGRGMRWSVLAGGLWGALSLLRANALLVGPIGVIWWLACPGLPRERRPKGALGFLAGFVVVLAPVSLVNLAVSRPHEFILTTWQGGAMFYTGNGPEASGVGEPPFIRRDPHLEADDFAAEAERRAGRRLTPGEVSSFWMSEGLRQWREAPLASLRFLAFKLGLLLNDLEVPDSQSPDWVRLVAAPGLGLAFLSFGWLVPWAAIGLTRTDRGPFWWFLSTTTVVGLITTAVFFVLGRYRVPWTPGLALLGAAGAVELARQVKARRWRGVAWRVLLVAAPVLALAWWPEVDPDPERWGYFQLALMVAYTQGGDLDAAIDALDDARAAASRVAASTTLLAQGWIHNQLAALVGRRWAETSKAPESALALARLARTVPETHALAGRLLDQVEHDQPESRALWRERGGWWLGRQHEDPSARRRAIEAYRRAEGDPSARVTLALLTADPGLLVPDPAIRPERIRLARILIDHQRRGLDRSRATSRLEASGSLLQHPGDET